tara:strand:+ start:133 stop:420 length:288 start_codon:yes stop_codon:yes gene_type:complete
MLLLVYLYTKRKSEREDRDILLLSQSQSESVHKISKLYSSAANKASDIEPDAVNLNIDDETVAQVDIGIDSEFLEEQKKCAFKQLTQGVCHLGFL